MKHIQFPLKPVQYAVNSFSLTSLVDITLPKCTRFRNNAFSNISTLTTVRMYGSDSEFGTNIFQYCPLLTLISFCGTYNSALYDNKT